MKNTTLALALVAAGALNTAQANDTVLKFVGICNNATCSEAGPNGTLPATVTAQITLSDLEWVAQDNFFAASFSAAKDFSYQGPAKFVHAISSDLVDTKVNFLSTSASLAGINYFDIPFANGAAYFSGNETGFGLGGYFTNVLGVSVPMNYESSTQVGQWSIAAVPEPESYAMFLAGLGLMGVMAGRRTRRS